MKTLSITVASLVPVLAIAMAHAATMDFAAVATPQGIVLPQAQTIADVTVGYDSFGGTDSATVGPDGLAGTTGGVLVINFATPVAQLSLDYSLPGASGSLADPVFVIVKNGGDDVADVEPNPGSQPTGAGGTSGRFAYQGVAIDQAFVYFATDVPSFHVTSVSYSVTPPPGQGDANGDGHVDVQDLLLLAGAFGAHNGDAAYSAACDFNSDGYVDAYDLLILVEHYDQ